MLVLARAWRRRERPSLNRRQRADLAALVEPKWMTGAVCASVDPILWETREGTLTPPAVARVCAGCEVRVSCLATAIRDGEQGMWAGTSQVARTEALREIRDGVAAETAVKQLLDEVTPEPPAAPVQPEPEPEPVPVPAKPLKRYVPRPRQLKPCPSYAAFTRGCRCDGCKEAANTYFRDRKRAKAAKKREQQGGVAA